MACGPFKTAGQGFAWTAAGLIVLAFLIGFIIRATAPATPLTDAAGDWV